MLTLLVLNVLTDIQTSPACRVVAAETQRPNVVLIITDDQGHGDLECHGNPVLKTPELNRLHAESVRLTDYHVAPTCSPTRSALLTGHWTNRTGVWHTIMGRSMLRQNETTIADVFQKAGYATGMFGKWHLGDNYPYRAEDRGFTEVLRHGGGGVGQTPDFWDNAYFDGSYFRNSSPEAVTGYCTDVWFEAAKQFILKQKQDGRPFFTYIATNAPHGPNHAPESFTAPYAAHGVQTANFFGMIANIDQNVGRLRDFLEEQQLTRNTIFIFTTDNGTAGGATVFNSGMRGQKGSPYDGGHRVPFFIYWPAGGLSGGRDVAPITAHVDVLPTLIDLCGIAAPKGVKFDGTTIRPLLEGSSSDWPDRILVTDSQRVKDPIKWRQSSVMTSQWRLINGEELYDMQTDPGQKQNIATQHAAVVSRLRRFYDEWWTELEPTFKQDCPIYLGHPAENPTHLTCHDWITSDTTPWNQAAVRDAQTGVGATGFWNVHVTADAEYIVRLRRWPEAAGAGINSSLPAGAEVPGVQAYRTRPGKAIAASHATLEIGDEKWKADVAETAEEVVFQVSLKSGTTRMTGLFHGAGTQMWGAYYASVERLP